MQPPSRYTLATEELITDAALTGEELRLLLFLQCHDLPDSGNSGNRKGFVFLSRGRCAERLRRGVRRISALLAGLEAKGFIRREHQDGKASRIVLLTLVPEIPLSKSFKGSNDPCTFCSRVEQPTLDENVQGSLEQKQQGTLEQNVQPEDKKEKSRKKEKNVRSSSATTPKRTTRKKLPIVRDLEKLQTLLDAIDLSPFRQNFPEIDVDALFNRFSDTVLHGTAKDPRPNPYDYRDFAKGFRNWCEREAGQNGRRPPTDPPSEKPKPKPRDLSTIEY